MEHLGTEFPQTGKMTVTTNKKAFKPVQVHRLYIKEVDAMKISKIYSGEYLCCLPPELYRVIIDAVELAISKLYLSEDDKKEALYNANCEKLYNLTDTIDLIFI